jgi:hypothetical protein
VLGQDFLRFSGAIIDCGYHSISMFDGLVHAVLTCFTQREAVLRLTQNVIIPAATEALVRLAVRYLHRHKLGLMYTFAPLKNKFLVVANALVQPKGPFTIGRILNIGQTPRKLRANTPIATIMSVDMEDPFDQAMLTEKPEVVETLESARNTRQMPEHEKRVKILTSLWLQLNNPNLTPEQFAQLTELLFQYQDIFCSDYEQLPFSKLPPHDIIFDRSHANKAETISSFTTAGGGYGKVCRQAP